MYYYAVKTFNEAVEGVMNSSSSLAQSDLRFLKAKDFSEVQSVIDKYYEEVEHSFGEPYISFEKAFYSQVIEENFNLAPRSEEEENEGFYYFSYSTSSGINNVMIREIKSGEEIIGYETVYSVESYKPLEYSTAMREFRKAGWQCSERAYELSEEEELSQKEEYEKELIRDILKYHRLPDVCFLLRYRQASPDRLPYITSHTICNNSDTIEVLLKNHPGLSEKIVEVIDTQIQEMDAIEIPTTYDYNDEICIDSDFYIKKREEVRKTLMGIKEKILARITREGIKAKEEELEWLQKEEQTISEAEQLVDRIEKDSQYLGDGICKF